MPLTARKTDASPSTKRKAIAAQARTQGEAIAAAVSTYVASLTASAALDAMFAEIDRNLEASEQRTARLLAQG